MSSKKKKPVSGGGGNDDRFLRVQKDPRFWEMPERERKVKIDKRFQSMFHDQRFKIKYTVDKRGRPVNHTSSEDLKRFYKVSDSEDEEEEEDVSGGKAEKKEKESKVERGGAQPGVRVIEEGEDDENDEEQPSDEEEEESEEESDEDLEEDEEESDEDSEEEEDLARGKGNIETSSDEDDDDEDRVDAILQREEEEIEHDWGELCKDAPRNDEVSTRLAVCNMDWDRIKAKDLLALLNSFSPKGGAVLSVKIYPSEFGKERLKMEETQAPPELRALPDDPEEDNEEEKVYREKMRDYQFKRLRYFYAVVQCDSVDTAAHIYSECDGYEYESSCSVLDLRFIPDDVAFEEAPRDSATDVNLAAYTPKLFTSGATTTSKVQLTWDETDHERVAAMSRKFNKDELLDMDFNVYLASSSSEEEEEEELEDGLSVSSATVKEEEEEEEKEERSEQQQEEKKKKEKRGEQQISKYRELLRGLQDKEKKLQEDRDMEMEITWVPGLKETTEKLVKKKLEGKEAPTPWEEFLEKKREKKKQKKKNKRTDEEVEEEEEDLSDDELPPDVDLSDPFFAEELAGADMKKNPKGKKKKKKKEEEEEPTAEEEEELQKRRAEMALLMEDDHAAAKHKHFNYDKIVEQQNLSKKKRKKLLKKGEEPLEEDDFQVDVRDPRFQAMFTSHLFNLDPSSPSYRKTKATQSILSEKQRRREQAELVKAQGEESHAVATTTAAAAATQEGAGPKRDTMDAGLSLLVKSIKNKTQQFQARKKLKVK
ncbi:ESF1 homolog [Nelusetta ayraudi]|uniref:ESF1 homolog n=1 Tax=Nelusetta ayraudi TaxID=303726 RepID=UPI003F70C3A7